MSHYANRQRRNPAPPSKESWVDKILSQFKKPQPEVKKKEPAEERAFFFTL